MSFKGKEVIVKLVGNAKESFIELNKKVGEDIKKGIDKSQEKTLLNAINEKADFLKDNPEFGKHIAKNKIPKEYIIDYQINNLWKVNLPGAWRMLYTIKGEEINIFAIILDVLNHKEYDKKMKYKKS